MKLCTRCLAKGFCQDKKHPIVSDQVIRDPLYLRDLKAFLKTYTFEAHIAPSEWPDHFADLYRDYTGWLHDAEGNEVFLNMDALEFEFAREWFRDFIELVQPGVMPRLRREAVERVRIIATLMSIYHPAQAMRWGKPAANDNEAAD